MSACAQFRQFGNTRSQIYRPLHAQLFGDTRLVMRRSNQLRPASTICVAASDVKCSAVQTLPRTERSKTMTKTPVRETVKTPKLDDSGPAPPPNGGGGGGGGGGGDSSGGWILFGILLFLSFLKEKETKEEEEQEKRSYRTVPTLDF